MEPVRPQVDAYLLDWIAREPLRREWFFEQRDGDCRLMGSLAVCLSETAPMWARAVATVAESVVSTLWATKPKPARQHVPATRLTQGHRREAKGNPAYPPAQPVPPPTAVCRVYGASVKPDRNCCVSCVPTVARKTLMEAAKLGRVAGHSPEPGTRQAEK